MVDRNDLRCTAFHEAGHAVAAVVLGIPFEKVFIVRDVDHASRPVGLQLGQVVRNFQKTELAGKGEDLALRNVVQAFAGHFGETLAYPNLPLNMPPDDPDVKDAWSILKFALCKFTITDDGQAEFAQAELLRNKARIEALFQQGIQDVQRFLATHREPITRVAEALLSETELSHERVVVLCRP